MFRSRFMPCQECGASLDRNSLLEHSCLSDRLADYQMFGLHDELAQLEPGIRRYLATRSGRFETWLAAQQVRRQR